MTVLRVGEERSVVSLVIEQFHAELRWLRQLSREVHRRAPARHPQ